MNVFHDGLPKICYAVFLCTVGVTVSSCSGQRPVSEPNPMPALWATSRTTIDRLEITHASPEKWAAVAVCSTRITSHGQLNQTLHYAGLDEAAICSVLAEWGKHDPVIHYGFDSNDHALVFFSSGRAVKVFKW